MANQFLRKRWPWIVAAGVVVAAYLSTFVEIRRGGDPRPLGSVADIERLADRDLNVLFILIDTLRADRLGSYGYERDTSPTLDLLAGSGVRFARNLAQSSWTKCSMASLWTGLYPARAGVTRFDHVAPAEARMPAEIMADAGFRTTAIFRNGWVSPYFGFGQGFEIYERPTPGRLPPRMKRENPTVKDSGSDDDLVNTAIEFLRVHGDDRWFLYLHLMDVHEYLYDEETALFGTTYSDVYDNSIRWTDSVLDRFFGHLAEQGHLEDTLVVIGSDHGEAFGERGLEGHARFVYRETTEVPLILVLPFRLEPGIVVETRTRNVDLWPTVLDLLGLPPLEHADGRSQVPAILAAARGEKLPDAAETAVAHLDRHWGQCQAEPSPTVAVAEDRYRYVRVPDGEGPPREELFDAGVDASERRNLLDEQPEVAARLRQMADDYLESEPPWGHADTLDVDEIELNQLRALGYAVP